MKENNLEEKIILKENTNILNKLTINTKKDNKQIDKTVKINYDKEFEIKPSISQDLNRDIKN